MHDRSAAALAAVLTAVAVTGCSAPAADRTAGEAPRGVPAAADLAARGVLQPRVALPAPAQLGSVPTPGTVGRSSGPFDDRYQLLRATLRAGTVQAVVRITSDVSGLVVMEVQGDFYDARGALLGSVRSEYSEGSGGTADTPRPAETAGIPVTVRAAAAWRSRVSSVVLSIPTLVNE